MLRTASPLERAQSIMIDQLTKENEKLKAENILLSAQNKEYFDLLYSVSEELPEDINANDIEIINGEAVVIEKETIEEVIVSENVETGEQITEPQPENIIINEPVVEKVDGRRRKKT